MNAGLLRTSQWQKSVANLPNRQLSFSYLLTLNFPFYPLPRNAERSVISSAYSIEPVLEGFLIFTSHWPPHISDSYSLPMRTLRYFLYREQRVSVLSHRASHQTQRNHRWAKYSIVNSIEYCVYSKVNKVDELCQYFPIHNWSIGSLNTPPEMPKGV